MARIFDAPQSAIFEQHQYQKADLGTPLEYDDGRLYRYGLAGATALATGKLMQSVAPLAGHTNIACDVARAIGAESISATLNTTAAAIDIYAEGYVHINDATGEGYLYRIAKACSAGDAHAAATSTGVLTVNLAAGVTVQVALVAATSEVSFTRNTYHSVIIHPSPPTAELAGVTQRAVTALYYCWLQRKGTCTVLGDGTLLAGLPIQASITVDGAVEGKKRRVRSGSTAAADSTAGTLLEDQDGSETVLRAMGASMAIDTTVDITGPISINAPTIGVCKKANADTEYAIVNLALE